jgi:RNA polymerase sigma factor (sigma-70 family)
MGGAVPDAAVRYADVPVVGRSRPVLALLGDDRLVEQVCRGSHAAFEALYERHHRGILAFCRHMMGSAHDAEEAVQQAFTAAYTDLTDGERPSSLKPWLYGIARHRCLEMLRRRRKEADAEETPEGVSPAVADEVERRTEVREMLSGVSRLPEPQRTALVLFGLCGHAQSDVAAVLGCDEARVRALVYQARASMLEDRRARETPCHEIRERLALGRGGALRRRAVRRHVKFCPSCAEFRAEMLRQRRVMGFIPPAAPSLALKTQVLTAVGLAASAGSAGSGGAATPVGGGLLLPRATAPPARTVTATRPAAAASAGTTAAQRPTWTPNAVPSRAPVAGPPTPAASPRHAHHEPAAGPPSPPPPAATPLDATLAPAPGKSGEHPHGTPAARHGGGWQHGHGNEQGAERQHGNGHAGGDARGNSQSGAGGKGHGKGHGGQGGGGGGGHGHGNGPNKGSGNAAPPQQESPPASQSQPPPSGDDPKQGRPCIPAVEAGPVGVQSGC